MSSSIENFAVIGLSCRLPGAGNKFEYWKLLSEGQEQITQVPEWRWNSKNYESSDANSIPGLMSTSRGAFLSEDQVKGFDCNVLGVSQKEVEVMDPQQRLLLELTWECLEDAGIRPKKDNTNCKLFDETGVFVGIGQLDYFQVQYDDNNFERISSYTHNGNTLSIASNRVSFLYDFRGPSMSIDTACSSSLVAIHQAIQSLRNKECEMAIAGGVSLILSPTPYVEFSKVGVLSKDGKCKPFDENANGFIRGEGAGLIVIKPLEKAKQDGDRIYAVIKGSSVNVDGAAEDSLITPSQITQSLNIQRTYERLPSSFGINPEDVDYVECHGTGTAKGDVVETCAIGEVFSGEKRIKPLYVGSVKGSIGHLECASGVAGLIKAILMMEKRTLCPSINIQKLNPKIPLEKYKMHVVQQKITLPKTDKPLLFGVNSMGIGGVNSHVLIEEYTEKTPQIEEILPEKEAEKILMLLSAQSIPSLQKMCEELVSKQTIYDKDSLISVATIQNQFRAHHKLRSVVMANGVEDCVNQLKAITKENADGLKQKGLVSAANRSEKGFVFVFPGQGPQTRTMGIQLYERYEIFRTLLDKCDALFQKLSGWSLVSKWIKEQCLSDDDFNMPQYAQPAIFFLQAGLIEMMKYWSIQPSAIIGHSAGEVASAYSAGVYTLEEAICILYYRSTLQQKTVGNGNMLAIGTSKEEAEKILDELLAQEERDDVVVAAINSPLSVTLAGSPELITKLEGLVGKNKGIFCRKLRGFCAFHSKYQDPIKEELLTKLKGFTPENAGKPTTIPLYSTVTGKLYDTTKETMNEDYLWGNVRQAVLFGEPITDLLSQGYRCFVELSPHPVLSASIKECAQELDIEDVKCFFTLKRFADETETMFQCVKDLFMNGYVHNVTLSPNIKWNELFNKALVPHYPWDRVNIWNQTEEQAAEWKRGAPSNLVGHKSLRTGCHIWQNKISLDHFPNLKDHVIQGDIIYPGIGYIMMSLHASIATTISTAEKEEQKQIPKQYVVTGCDFKDALSLAQTPSGGMLVETVVNRMTQSTQNSQLIEIRSKRGLEEWLMHYKCAIRILPPTNLKTAPSLEEVKSRCNEFTMSKSEIYSKLRKMSLDYGPYFSHLDKINVGNGECLSELHLKKNYNDGTKTELDIKRLKAVLEVGIIDSCLQSLIAIADEDSISYIPSSIDTCVLNTDILTSQQVPDMDDIYVYCKLNNQSQYELEGDVFIYGIKDNQTHLISSFLSVRCRAITQTSSPNLFNLSTKNSMYDIEWATLKNEDLEQILSVEQNDEEEAESIGKWIIVNDGKVESPITKSISSALNGEATVVETEELLTLLNENAPKVSGIVFLANITHETEVAQEQSAWKLMKILQQLIKMEDSALNINLWIVTKGAQLTYQIPTSAQFVGIGRTFRSEQPSMNSFLFDFSDGDANAEEVIPTLSKLLLNSTKLQYHELAYHNKALNYVKIVNKPKPIDPTMPVTLKSNSIGSVSELSFHEVDEQFPKIKDDEVRIFVKCSALSFKDLMFSLGRIPEKAFRRGGKWNPPFGLECSGVIVDKGSKVTHLNLGDAVVCMARYCFSTYVTVKVNQVVKKPDWMTFEQAATIPSAFLTSYYGLVYVARLKEGETCLIHSAAGAVGLSAIQICNHLNAVTIGSAGRGEKRDFIEKDPTYKVQYTTDSRSTRFRDDVLKYTNQKGCDVVLNSLAGTDMLTACFESLGPYGRMVEIGIKDIYDGTTLNLQTMHRNLSYTAVDLDRMMDEKPELIQQIFQEVMDLMEKRRLSPLPLVVYDKEKVIDAFNFMAHAKHIGKIVLNMTNEPLDNAVERYQELQEKLNGLRFSNGTILVVGGTRGVGLSLVSWIIEQKGAKNVVIVSRSGKLTEGPSKEKLELLMKQEKDLRVEVLACDVSNKTKVAEMITKIKNDLRMPPLEAVFHLATVYEDASINNMVEEKFRSVIQAKAVSAWNIHECTKQEPLKYFVMFSSFVALNGNMEQSNYAAANCVLDALAHHRKMNGLPALSVNFGAIDDGFVSRVYSTKVILRSRGFISMPIPLLVKCLEKVLLENNEPQKIISSIDWKDHSDSFKHLKAMFGDLFVESENEQANEETSQLSIDQMILNQLSKILGVPVENLDLEEPLRQYGMDSLMATQLKNWLDKVYPRGAITTIDILKKETTVKSLATKITEKMGTAPTKKETKKETKAPSKQIKPIVETKKQEVVVIEKKAEPTLSPTTVIEKPQETIIQPTTSTAIIENIPRREVSNNRKPNLKSSNNSFILGLGTANPPSKSQEELFNGIIKDYGNADQKIKDRIHNLFKASEIKERCVAFDFTKHSTNDLPTIESRNDLFMKMAPEYAYQAAKKAIDEWKGDVKEITHLITCTSTGIAVPNIHLKFMDRLGLSHDIEYFPINMSGCAAGVITLKTAKAINALYPNSRVLIICIELSSVHFRISNNTDEKIVTAIFGDGVAAMVVGSNPELTKERPIYELFETQSYTTPNSEECMQWKVFSDGFHLSLSPEVPMIITESLKGYMDNLLRKSKHKDEIILKNNCDVLPHPGGKAILYAVEKSLNLNRDELESAWEVMSKHGNMSSVTVLFVMNHYRTSRRYLNNEWSIAVAFGPGVSTESVILRNCCGGASNISQ
ncbi:hypothetical protein ABK040_005788 [Willaertia magna]